MKLKYLTDNDWALLRSKARRATFKPREILITINSRPAGLFVLVSGTASVEVVRNTPVAKLSPGEICGEMAFIESGTASASVVAETELEADVLELGVLNDVFITYPHLEARFYKSLALLLSQRLRSTLVKMSKTSAT